MCIAHNGAAVEEANPYRLPRTVIPRRYKLHIKPDIDSATFTGEVAITINVLKAVDEIVLNAADLTVTQATVRNIKRTALNGTIIHEPENERVRIKVKGRIGTGTWQLHLRFAGTINDQLRGFYRSTYTDDNGVEQVIATTQFESHDARRAFPCFDEPDLKAVFQISLEVKPELAAISNTRVMRETRLANGNKLVEFAPSMVMSTYIVAYVVGKLVPSKTVSVDGVDVRMWCVPGKEHLTAFSLEACQFSLRYFKRYFGVAYPGDKMDMVAIPDFAAGAMENLGCVTYRETVLIDPATAPQSALDWVAEVVSHENAHMWFGNLVTMKWWHGLWLNEAFATFMATKCVDAFKSSWGVWDKFGLSRSTALRTDALLSTRPIEFVVRAPEDAAAMFDVLTYEKGGSVLRMLEQYLGEETFRKGIARYIQTYAYGNTETDNLWDALEEASRKPVGDIMHNWIYTGGYPLVSVETSDLAGSVTIRQQPFKFLPQVTDGEPPVWQVPLKLKARTADGTTEINHLLTEREETIYIGENIEWVIVNSGGHGFYRTIYSADLRDKLTANVQETLSVIERFNLLSDTWASVQAGIRQVSEFVELCELFKDERNANVWSIINTGLSTVRNLLPEADRPQLEAKVRALATPAFKSVGWSAKPGESTNSSELRGELIGMLGLTGQDKTMVKQAEELYAGWKKDRSAVSGDVFAAVIALLSASEDSARYEEFYSYYKSAANPADEENFLYALARFKSPELLERTLKHALNPAAFRTQDAPYVVARVMANSAGRELAWKFLRDNWDHLLKLYPHSGFVRLCSAVTALNTPELEQEVHDWFDAHPVPGGGKTIDQTLELLRVAVLLRQREEQRLSAHFSSSPPESQP